MGPFHLPRAGRIGWGKEVAMMGQGLRWCSGCSSGGHGSITRASLVVVLGVLVLAVLVLFGIMPERVFMVRVAVVLFGLWFYGALLQPNPGPGPKKACNIF